MSFDWRVFLDRLGVEYVTSGPSVVRGNVAIHCPFCGAADRGHHMSVGLEGQGWKCWRDHEHRGRSPVRLIRALAGCSTAEAREIAGLAEGLPERGVLAEVESLLAPAPPENPPEAGLDEPVEFKRFGDHLPSRVPFLRYMRDRRGFTGRFLEGEGEALGLRYCTRGPFAGRVVLLIVMDDLLVNWTARSVSSRAVLRYRTLSDRAEVARDSGLPRALLPVDRCLLWYDDYLASGGEYLFLVEGPIDALKLRSLGLAATCFFTTRPSRWQVDLLRTLRPRFGRLVVLPDRGAEAQAMETRADLAALGAELADLPPGADDPGEFDRHHARALLGGLAKRA